MKLTIATTIMTGILIAGSGTTTAGPLIQTDKLKSLPPDVQAPVQQKSVPEPYRKAMQPIAAAQVRPVFAEHSARPTREWCTERGASTIEGRVSMTYNFPGRTDGAQLQGIIIVHSNGADHRTNVTVYPGLNRVAISDSIPFAWRDACPPNRVSVRLQARNPADRARFVPVTIYASPDRADHPDWY